MGFRPDVIVSSPKVRAVQTARIAARALGLKVRTDDRLASGFGLAQLATLLEDVDAARPVLVGHDPDFSMLLSILSGAVGLEMKKAAFARVDTQLPAGPASGMLRWLVPPDLLERS